MRELRRVAVYCGSSNEAEPAFYEAARTMGRLLGERGIGLVYGGGSVGLMGAVADAALDASGEVIGVIPEKLRAREVHHTGIGELVLVDSMHARKSIMAALSDAFMVLPGGFGTMDELFEAVTWTQLGYHQKPVGLLNTLGFYDALLAFLDHAAKAHFIRPEYRRLINTENDPEALLDLLGQVDLPAAESWSVKP